MRSVLAGQRQIVVPWGAPSTEPRIVLGPDIPPVLDQWLAAFNAISTDQYVWVGSQVWWYNEEEFSFDALLEENNGLTQWRMRGTAGATVGSVYFNEVTAGNSYRILFADGAESGDWNQLFTGATPDWFYGPVNLRKSENTATYYDDGAEIAYGQLSVGVTPRSLPRGCIVNHITSGAAAGFDTSEDVVWATGGALFRAGRVYDIVVRGKWSMSTAGAITLFRIRKGNTVAGAQVCHFENMYRESGQRLDIRARVGNYTGDPVSFQFCLTAVASAGTGTFENGGWGSRNIEVWDVGSTDQFTGEYPLTP